MASSETKTRKVDAGDGRTANPNPLLRGEGGPAGRGRMRAAQNAIKLLPYQRRWVKDDSKLKIAVKARQIGYSFAATLRAVNECLKRKTTWIFLSKGERQSRLLMEKVQDHVRTCGIVARASESAYFEGTSLKQLEVRFANGSVIYGLPANPDTARGYTGHVTLDEFAFHADADKIYAALFPTITRGYGIEVISTPNGTQGKFYELAKAAGLLDPHPLAPSPNGEGSFDTPSQNRPLLPSPNGERSYAAPARHHALLPSPTGEGSPDAGHRDGVGRGTWSAHYCDIYDAVRQGLQVDVALLRSGCEEESAWQQEFCCQFVSTVENFFSPDLLAACLSAEASTDMAPSLLLASARGTRQGAASPEYFLGIDIGRRHDRTVFWVDEVTPSPPAPLPEGEGSSVERGRVRVSTARLVHTMENTPFDEQLRYARELLSLGSGDAPPLIPLLNEEGRLRRVIPLLNEEGKRANCAPLLNEEGKREARGGPFLIRRAAIDATGIGAMLAETLQKEFGPRVEPVIFTAALKENLAFRTRRRMEARATLLPDTREIRRAFSAVKKFVTPSGNFRFDAARTESGHADEFWAKALADLAADPEAHRATAAFSDGFLADAAPLIVPSAFAVPGTGWAEGMM